jgi:hypothetical protein
MTKPRGKQKIIDVTKPHRKQFFKCTKIADEPPLNAKGFWDKPVNDQAKHDK